MRCIRLIFCDDWYEADYAANGNVDDVRDYIYIYFLLIMA